MQALDPNAPHCTCDNLKCPRHGNCQACVLFHREEKCNLPRCLKYMLAEQELKQSR